VLSTTTVFLLVLPLFVPGVFGTIGELLTGQEGTGSLETRGNATEIGLNLIGDKPWFGHGFSVSGISPIIIDNQYLVTGLELGLVGLVAFLWLMGTGIVNARRARRLTDDASLRDLGQSFVAMIAAVALGGFGLNVLRFPLTAGLLFVGVGGAGALLRIVASTDRVDEEAGRTELIGTGS
jgi:O-antigen ligase